MTNDIDHLLNGLLADWHLWSRPVRVEGYAGRAAGFGQSRSNSQFDWENGLESDMVERRIMEGFDNAAQRVPQPWLTALQFEAKNLAVRHQVWASPRLPADMKERDLLILEARNKLIKELARDGIIC